MTKTKPYDSTMAPRLRSSQARQSIAITTGHHTITAADQEFNHEDELTEDTGLSDNEDLHISEDDSEPHLSNSSTASRDAYNVEYDDVYLGNLERKGIVLANLAREPPTNLNSVLEWLNRTVNESKLHPAGWVNRLNTSRQHNKTAVAQFVTTKTLSIMEEYWTHPDIFLSCKELWNEPQPLTEVFRQVAPDFALGLKRRAITERFPGLMQPGDLLDDLQMMHSQFFATLTVEVVGPEGTENRAVLQNMHNASLMLKRREDLNKMLKRKRQFDDGKILALSIVHTHYDLTVWGHWKVTEKRGKRIETKYLSARLATTYLNDMKYTQQLGENAFGWSADQLLERVMPDLGRLNKSKLRKG